MLHTLLVDSNFLWVANWLTISESHITALSLVRVYQILLVNYDTTKTAPYIQECFICGILLLNVSGVEGLLYPEVPWSAEIMVVTFIIAGYLLVVMNIYDGHSRDFPNSSLQVFVICGHHVALVLHKIIITGLSHLQKEKKSIPSGPASLWAPMEKWHIQEYIMLIIKTGIK